MGRIKSRGVLVAISMSHRGVNSSIRCSERRVARQLNQFPRTLRSQSAHRDGIVIGLPFALDCLLSNLLHRHPDWPSKRIIDGFGELRLRWLDQYTAELAGTLYRFRSNVALACIPMPFTGWLRIGPNGKHLRGYQMTFQADGHEITVQRAAQLAHAAERAQRDRSVYP